MPIVKQQNNLSEVAVAMDRGLRVFADFARPILEVHSADHLSMANLLFLVSIGHGDAHVNDLVKRGRYVGSNASYALKALTNGGFIDRKQDPSDRRNGVVAWTDKGQALVEAIKAACLVKQVISKESNELLRLFEDHCIKLPVV